MGITIAVGIALVLVGAAMIVVGWRLEPRLPPSSGVPLALIYASYLPLTLGLMAIIVPIVAPTGS